MVVEIKGIRPQDGSEETIYLNPEEVVSIIPMHNKYRGIKDFEKVAIVTMTSTDPIYEGEDGGNNYHYINKNEIDKLTP